MAEEGKISRAMAKSAGAVVSPAAPGVALIPSPAPVAAAPAAQTARPAAIQRVKDHWGPPTASVMLFHDRVGQFTSEMRSLRANIVARTLNNGKSFRVLTVTSAGRTEGKTTVCANLAAALGEVEPGRIIILDGDIFQPCVHLTMNVRVQSGLRAVLEEGLKLDGHIYETAIPNVDILPSFGVSPGEKFEGLIDRQLAKLLEDLRKYYSYVIIDTPPVLAGSPAATFAKRSDGVILIARLEKTPREVVKRTKHDLTAAGATIIGCVLTHRIHHVPDIIYRYLGTTPSHYYRYGRDQPAKKAGAESQKAKAVSMQQEEVGQLPQEKTGQLPQSKTGPLQHFELDRSRGRRRLILYLSAAVVLLAVLAAGLVRYFAPEKLGEIVAGLKQLLH